MKPAIHFVGFRDDAYTRAVQVFGKPDFIHRIWDGRAKSMIVDGDEVVFATGTENDSPQKYSFDDSAVF